MSKQIPAKRVARHDELTARELWLAGLGAVSLTRKQALAGIDQVAYLARQLREQAEAGIEQGTSAVETSICQAREFTRTFSDLARSQFDQARSRSAKVLEQALAEAGERIGLVRGEVEQRLAPVLTRLGLAASAPKRHAPARKKTGTAARKPRTTTGKRAAKAA
ncbi:hypothetical protein [Methylocystis sp.]|uniref:hypothetical protein n=1 Tax=Methylocystis sp. TaxID=1911079 RepID=UPI003DA2F633